MLLDFDKASFIFMVNICMIIDEKNSIFIALNIILVITMIMQTIRYLTIRRKNNGNLNIIYYIHILL